MLAEVIAGGEVVLLGQAIIPDGPAGTRWSPSGGPPTTVPRGVLVASLNPQVPVNDGFRLFLDVVSTTLGSALDNARAPRP